MALFVKQNSTYLITLMKLTVLLYLLFTLKIDAINIDSGGWTTNPSDMIAQAGPCNIPVRNASLTQTEFLERYAYKEPVVIQGSSDNSEIRIKSAKEYLLSKFANKTIRLSSANTYSYKKVDVTLLHYVNEILRPQRLTMLGNETLYWFGDHDHNEWDDLFSSYVKPSFSLPGLTEAYSFGIAGPGTGVPFHFHGPGFAEVIYGQKRWFMYPPHFEPQFNPDKTTLHWLIEEYPKLTGSNVPLECTVGPGEIIYFPDHWWHSTLNVETSVFISTFLG